MKLRIKRDYDFTYAVEEWVFPFWCNISVPTHGTRVYYSSWREAKDALDQYAQVKYQQELRRQEITKWVYNVTDGIPEIKELSK